MLVADHELRLSEKHRVMLHRYAEARRFGFTRVEAHLYADSDIDCSELRRLVRAKWPPAKAAKLLL